MRKPGKFTEADLRRAIRAVTKEGLSAHVEITLDGRMVISTTHITAAGCIGATGPNEWDKVL
jgi:hypothetical protein